MREIGHLFAEMDVGAELQSLFYAKVDELLTEDLRMARDVINMLLGIDGGDLAAELAEALDDADRRVSVARVVGGREPHRPGADDRDVANALAHSGVMLPLAGKIEANALVAAAGSAAPGSVRCDRLGTFEEKKRGQPLAAMEVDAGQVVEVGRRRGVQAIGAEGLQAAANFLEPPTINLGFERHFRRS